MLRITKGTYIELGIIITGTKNSYPTFVLPFPCSVTCLPLCYSLLVSFYLVPADPSCFPLLSNLNDPPNISYFLLLHILTASSTPLLFSHFSLMIPPALYSSCSSYSLLLFIPLSDPDTFDPSCTPFLLPLLLPLLYVILAIPTPSCPPLIIFPHAFYCNCFL